MSNPPNAPVATTPGPPPQQATPRRPRPKRYPAIGFGALFAFVLVTSLLAMRKTPGLLSAIGTAFPGAHGTIQSGRRAVADEGAEALPDATKRAFVKLGRESAKLRCLARFSWDRPDGPCRDAVVRLSYGYRRLIVPDLDVVTRTGPAGLAEALASAVELGERVKIASVIESAPGPAPAQIELMLADLARRGASVADRIDEVLPLDDPRWDAPAAEAPAAPAATAVPAGTVPAATVTAPLAQVPPASPAVAVVPAAAAVAAPAVVAVAPPEASPPPTASAPAIASATAPASATASATPGEARDAAGAGSPAPALPPVRTGPEPRSLVEPLVEIARSLGEAGRDPLRIADAVARARDRLGAMDVTVNAYREAPRAAEHREAALALARRVDQARGKLLRAATDLAAAVKASEVRSPDGMSTDPFPKAEATLAAAADEVRAAQALAATAP